MSEKMATLTIQENNDLLQLFLLLLKTTENIQLVQDTTAKTVLGASQYAYNTSKICELCWLLIKPLVINAVHRMDIRYKHTFHGWLATQPSSQPDNSNGRGEGMHWNVMEACEENASVSTGSLRQTQHPKVTGWEHPRQTDIPKTKKVQMIGRQWTMGGPGEKGKVFLCCLHTK